MAEEINNNTIEDINIKLKSFEGEVYECKLSAAKMSAVIDAMLDTTDFSNDNVIPLQNNAITNTALKKIIEYMEYHWDDPEDDPDLDEEKDRRNEELSYWDKHFIDVPDLGLLYDITLSANFLDIKGLVEVCAKHICSKIKGKTPQEVRQILNIRNDFTPEEEAAIIEENKWICGKD